MGASNFVHLDDCNILAVTDKAVLIQHDGQEYWIPVSQLADGEDHPYEKGDKEITVSLSEWICKAKGIDF